MQAIKKLLTGVIFLFALSFIQAQPALPDVMLKVMRGGAVASFSSITGKDSVVLLCFWATGSEQSISELNAINGQYQKWKAITAFKLMAVSVDEGQAANKVRPISNMNGWTFDVYTDINGDLRNVLHANNLPEVMIIRRGRVLYQQSGFAEGSENYLLQKIQSAAGQKN